MLRKAHQHIHKKLTTLKTIHQHLRNRKDRLTQHKVDMDNESMQKNPKLIYLLAILFVILILFVIIYYASQHKKAEVTYTPLPTPSPKSIVDPKTKTAYGKITNINGNRISVINSKGEAETFEIANTLKIYKYPSGSKESVLYSSKEDLELNTEALITFVIWEESTLVDTVAYLPGNTRIATSSAKNR